MKSSQIPWTDVQCALGCRFIAANFLWRQSNCAASIASQASPFYALSLQEWGDKDSIQMYICASCRNIFPFSLDKRKFAPWMRAGSARGWKKSAQLTPLFAERIQLLCAEVLIFCHAYIIFMQSAVLIRLKHQHCSHRTALSLLLSFWSRRA